MPLLQTLMPDPLAVVAAVLAIGMIAALGLPLARQRETVVAFAAGMGMAVLLYTATGILADGLFGWAAGLIAVAALAVLIRLRPTDWAAEAGKGVVLALPLLLLVSGRIASEWDEFSHWQSAFRYVATFLDVPGGPGTAPITTCCAAYPYGWPMIGFPALKIAGGESVPALLNTLALAAFGLLLARLAAPGRRVGWGLAALGILAVTVASPTFVPKLTFSSYADTITGVLVGVLAYLAPDLSDRMARKYGVRETALAFGLTAAALVAVKPGNAGLLISVFGGLALLFLADGAWRRPSPWLLAVVGLPALSSGLWRWHVGLYLHGQEMTVRPLSEWRFDLLPDIMGGIATVLSNKGGYAIFALAVIVLGVRGLLGRRDNPAYRLATMAGAAVAAYNLFLIVTYLSVFGEYEARHVASYWRYNTHLGPAVLLPIAAFAGLWARGGPKRMAWLTRLAPVAVALILIAPAAAVKHIRFDRVPMKAYLRETLREVRRIVPEGARAAIYDPQGTGLVGVMATYEWNGDPVYAGVRSAFTQTPLDQWLSTIKSDWVWVVSGRDAFAAAEQGPAGTLLHRTGPDSFEAMGHWPFPGGAEPGQYP